MRQTQVMRGNQRASASREHGASSKSHKSISLGDSSNALYKQTHRASNGARRGRRHVTSKNARLTASLAAESRAGRLSETPPGCVKRELNNRGNGGDGKTSTTLKLSWRCGKKNSAAQAARRNSDATQLTRRSGIKRRARNSGGGSALLDKGKR